MSEVALGILERTLNENARLKDLLKHQEEMFGGGFQHAHGYLREQRWWDLLPTLASQAPRLTGSGHWRIAILETACGAHRTIYMPGYTQSITVPLEGRCSPIAYDKAPITMADLYPVREFDLYRHAQSPEGGEAILYRERVKP